MLSSPKQWEYDLVFYAIVKRTWTPNEIDHELEDKESSWTETMTTLAMGEAEDYMWRQLEEDQDEDR